MAPYLKANDLIILESTSPVGTTANVRKTLKKAGIPTDDPLFACCPERVIPGNAMCEIVTNNRIVGGLTEGATVAAAQFYSTFVSGEVHQTNAHTAEMVKLTENASRDVNIAFATNFQCFVKT